MSKETIRFKEASYSQLERTVALIDHLDIATVEWLLGWTMGIHATWAADYDLSYFENNQPKGNRP